VVGWAGTKITDNLLLQAVFRVSWEESVIYVIATIELYPDKRERFLLEFTQLVPKVRAEDGCIEYGGATDLSTGLLKLQFVQT
jgi:hypothetical protein